MTGGLRADHRQHFRDDGWKEEEIDLAVQEYGVRSVSQEEAVALLGFSQTSGGYPVTSGIWFPFDDKGFGQLRLDAPGDGGPKYLSPSKKKARPCVWRPKGVKTLADLKSVTEGWKDAFIGTIRGGQPIGAIAGVSHVPTTLLKGAGLTLVFDSDGLSNANVAQALIKGGLHLGGKIALIPQSAGEKAGFTEFFNAGFGQEDFNNLLAGAAKPRKFLLDWLDYLLAAPLPKHCDTEPRLYTRLWQLSWLISRDCVDLKARIETFCLAHSREHGAKLSKPDIRSLRNLALAQFFKVEVAQKIEARKKEVRIPKGYAAWATKDCFDGLIGLGPRGSIVLPQAGKLAAAMEHSWGRELQYRSDLAGFYAYGRTIPGLWERVSDREVKELVQRELDAAGAAGEYGQTAVDSTVVLLSQRVAVRRWPSSVGLVPFPNGVLRLSDKTLLAHSPAYGLTWQLPYPYTPGATCDPIVDWLTWAVEDDASVVQLLRACLKAIVLGRTDFQRYLELIGPGGTGKGTFIRLVQALVGITNTVSTSLSRIANSRFETSRFLGKRLIFIPDADYNPTAVDTLKQMTGGDHLPLERKNENPDYNDGFTLEGLVLVATNKETIPSDRTNALFRRRIPIYFSRVVPEGERRCLLDFGPDGKAKGDFLECLPGLFNWVLDLPDELMEAYIKTPLEYVRSIGGFQADSLLNTDSMAQWIEEWVVYEPGAWTQIGNKGQSSKTYLYPSYCAYCEGANIKAVGLPTFVKQFESLFSHQLGLETKRGRLNSSTGNGFYEVRLRKTQTEPVGQDVYGPSEEVPVEEAPLTVSRALRGKITHPGKPLSGGDLTRFLNLNCDDPDIYQSELTCLTPEQVDYLYQELPELKPQPNEVNGHARH